MKEQGNTKSRRKTTLFLPLDFKTEKMPKKDKKQAVSREYTINIHRKIHGWYA
jgi:hypothetical protein